MMLVGTMIRLSLSAGLTEDAQAASVRLRRLNEEYRAFSKAAGLPEQRERLRALDQGGSPVKKALETKAESGIMKSETSKEIPEMPKDSAQRRRSEPLDVTKEYLDSATPNSHAVQDLQSYAVDGVTYTVDGHNVVLDYSLHEKEIAELLERKLGGEIFMVPRVNTPQGISTPDYLFRGKAYDLKTLEPDAGSNTIWNRIKKAKKQAHKFVIDVTKAKKLPDEVINGQLEKIFKDRDTLFVDEIILVRDNKIVKIFKRAQKRSLPPSHPI